MCRFHSVNFSDAQEDEAINYIIGDDDGWGEGCCEDAYDDDEEENEREWCD